PMLLSASTYTRPFLWQPEGPACPTRGQSGLEHRGTRGVEELPSCCAHDRLLDKKMAPVPLFEALSAIAVSSPRPSWTRRLGWKHRACQRTAAKRSSSYIDTWLHSVRK